jgi:ketosteroid isomerase-like protein
MDVNVAAVINASQDALVERDVDRYVSLMAEDVAIDDPSAPRTTGREAARKFAEGLLGLCSEVAFLDRKVFVAGRSAAMRFTLRCRTASGKEAVVDGIDVFEVNEAGLVQSCKSYYDPTPLGALMGG